MKNKCIGMLLVFVLLLTSCCPIVAFAEIPKAYGDIDEIWGYLTEYCPNEQIAAGIFGFFFRESRLKSDSVAGWPFRNIGLDADICESFTGEVDKGLKDGSTREYFIDQVNVHLGGYGLGQWSAVVYLEHFYDFMSEHADSIGDVRAQCEFVVESLKQNEELWEDLLTCNTAIQCGRRIGYRYDCTDYDGSEAIAAFADYFYRHLKEE